MEEGGEYGAAWVKIVLLPSVLTTPSQYSKLRKSRKQRGRGVEMKSESRNAANPINKVTIIGMGALGVLYGDFFAEKLGVDSVTFLADGDRIRRYEARGISCNGKMRRFHFQAVEDGGEEAELLIFAVKATALDGAVRMAEKFVGDHTVVLSVLNGISSEEILGAAFGKEKVLYCIAQGMDAVKDGNRVSYSHIGRLCIGITDREQAKRPMLERVEELFLRAGLPYVEEEDILHRLWSKWMLNVGVNQVVMVEEGTYRTVQEPGEARNLMIAAMREVILIASKAGIAVTEADLCEYLELIDSLNPDGMPSMRQDGLAKRPTEVELFAGTVIKKAKEYNISVPVNEELYRRVKMMENTYKFQ